MTCVSSSGAISAFTWLNKTGTRSCRVCSGSILMSMTCTNCEAFFITTGFRSTHAALRMLYATGGLNGNHNFAAFAVPEGEPHRSRNDGLQREQDDTMRRMRPQRHHGTHHRGVL